MCFSAEASFTAAAVLGGGGLLTVGSTKKKSHLLFALIPFLYAIQQLAEGFVWVALAMETPPPTLMMTAKLSFLFFAFLFWPVWIPLSLMVAEEERGRKKLLGYLLAGGTILSLYYLGSMIGNEVIVSVVKSSIQYRMKTPLSINIWILIGMYTVFVLVPCFISSMKLVWGYGILGLLSWIAAEYFYHETFASTWCFFAAIISLYVYLVIRVNGKESH